MSNRSAPDTPSRFGAPGEPVDLVAALQAGPDLLAVVSADGTLRACSGPVETVLGRRPVNLLERLHPADAPRAAEFLATVAAEPRTARGPVGWRAGGSTSGWREIEATATNRLDDPAVGGIVVVLRDVADRTAIEADLRMSALTDDLTGLPNRALFYDQVEQALAREGRHVALLYLDLDGFKSVNERAGHAGGDVVLVEIAQRLRSCLRSGESAARLGGDEFGVLFEGVRGPNDAVQGVERILHALLGTAVLVDGCEIGLRASIGAAVAAGRDLAADELLRRADVALHAAKRGGTRPWVLYEERLEATRARRARRRIGPAGWFARTREQRDEVAAVLDREDAIVPVYQPIMDLRTGLVAGYEALARFPRTHGRPPNEWFSMAHRCGLGFRLEARAFEAALAATLRPVRTWLSVNLSPSALCSRDLRDVLPDRLDGVVIEITENEQVPDDDVFVRAREMVRERGGRIAVDDTGAGYAGLRQLMRLRPEVLKLDRAVVHGIARDAAKAALVESLVRYGREIGATVCAEGIETLEDLRVLADLDVTYGQGWAIARPAAPWTSTAPEAADVCRASVAEALRRGSSEQVRNLAHDRRLEWLTWRLSEATSFAQLAEAVDHIAEELHADDLSVSLVDEPTNDLVFVGAKGLEALRERFHIPDFPQTERILREQETAQVLASDPAADRAELSLLDRLGMRSVLILPIVCAGRAIGLLEAYSRDERPWSRFEIGRARIVALQLGAALDRISRL